MLFNHTPTSVSHHFDDENLTATAGLVPIMGLAQKADLLDLADDRLTVSTTGADKGANPAAKLATLIGGMAAGADSIDDMNLLRHGGMTHLFDCVYAPSTLGSFLRSFAFGHVRQLDAISARFFTNLNDHTPLLPTSQESAQTSMIFVDIDDTIIDVHSAAKQGAGFGYQGSRGLSALFATGPTAGSSQIIVGQRLRKGSTSSARGADKFVSDALATTQRTMTPQRLSALIRRTTHQPWPKLPGMPGLMCRSRCAWTRRSKQRSEQSAMMHGRALTTRMRSMTKRPRPGFRRLKSLRSRSPRSPRRRSPCTPPGGWSFAASRRSTKPNALPGRTHCSTYTVTTRFSLPSTGIVSTLSLLICQAPGFVEAPFLGFLSSREFCRGLVDPFGMDLERWSVPDR